MAKVKVIGLDTLAKKINSKIIIEINKIFRNKLLMAKIGDIIIDDIKNNVDFGSASKELEKYREYLEKYNKTDSKYERNRIKGLFTGELFQDLRNNIKADTTKKEYIIEHSNKLHSRYNGKKGKIGKAIAYNELSKILINDLNYDYFQLTEDAKSKINNLLKKEITKAVSRV